MRAQQRIGLPILALVVLVTASSAWAANATWIGGTGPWDDSNTANWSGGYIPKDLDTVYLTPLLSKTIAA